MPRPRPARRARPRSPLWRVALWGIGLTLFVLLVAGVFAARRLVTVERDLRAARDLLESAGTAIEEGRLADARGDLEQARFVLVQANTDLHQSMSLEAVGHVPGISNNIQSLRESVGLTLSLAGGGARMLEVAQPLEAADGSLEVPLRQGAIPLEVVSRTQNEASGLAASLPGPAERPPDALLIGPVSELQDSVFEEVLNRRTQLVNVANGLELITDMSGANGPRRYLLAVANTAEMRGTGGMILSYGVLESADGDFSLEAFGQIDELFLQTGVDPAILGVSADEEQRWGGLEITRLWRNANVLPDFSVVGPRLAAMYETATGQPVDGVVQIDASGLAAILEGIGPVDVDGVGTVTSENAVSLTLNEAYTLLPDQDQRREVLGDVAEVTFRRLVDGEYDSLRALGTALFRAASERHIEVWSARPGTARPVAFFAADGSLPDPTVTDSLLLTVQNFSRNKLDFYLGTAVTVRGSRPAGLGSELEITVDVMNGAPAGQTSPDYVFGSLATSGFPSGTYSGIASLYVPTGTRLLSATGDAEASTATEDGRTVVGWQVDLAPGERSTVTLQVVLPARPLGAYAIALVPQPRVRPTVYDVDVDGDERVEGSARFRGPLKVPLVVSDENGDG